MFKIEPRVACDRVYRIMDQTWMLQQVPWAVLLFFLGGVSFVVWGISVRIIVSLLGHWFIGYLAHNWRDQHWHLEGHAIQGYNIPHLGLITMGESWHNNHHAFPESARLGHRASQLDPGWWALCLLRSCGLAWNLKTPADLPFRSELHVQEHPTELARHA